MLILLGGMLWHISELKDAAVREHKQVDLVNEQRALAQEREQAVRQRRYVSDINRAYSTWKAGDLPGMQKLLDRGLPQPNHPDLPRLEWSYLRLMNTPDGNRLFTLP